MIIWYNYYPDLEMIGIMSYTYNPYFTNLGFSIRAVTCLAANYDYSLRGTFEGIMGWHSWRCQGDINLGYLVQCRFPRLCLLAEFHSFNCRSISTMNATAMIENSRSLSWRHNVVRHSEDVKYSMEIWKRNGVTKVTPFFKRPQVNFPRVFEWGLR